jgi:hypothetical protein
MTLAIRRSSIARSVRINHRLLFHLPTDPHEMNNLAEDAAHAPEVARLTAMMETWRVSLGDKDPLSVANPEPMQPVYDNSSRTRYVAAKMDSRQVFRWPRQLKWGEEIEI